MPIVQGEPMTSVRSPVPLIDDEYLQKCLDRIRPVVRFAKDRKGLFINQNGRLYYIEPVDPRTYSFIWDPRPIRRAKHLCRITTLNTYHDSGSPFIFRPSIDEVIAQIPEFWIDDVVAFETFGPEIVPGDYHIATTILYGKK